MSIYVDDANIQASVRNGARTHTSRWCHLIADTPEELHEFAARLGLRRSWFQKPKGVGRPVNPESRAAQNWHYDLTTGKRTEAIRLGAIPVTSSEMSAIIDARYERLHPAAAAEWRAAREATLAKWAALRTTPATTEGARDE